MYFVIFITVMAIQPFPKQQILDSSKLKDFADENLKFDENGRKFSKTVENTVGKGEIACYEHFSFSQSVFTRLVLQARKHQGLFGRGLTVSHAITTIDDPAEEPYGKHCWKRRKCWLPAFSPFPTMFPTIPRANLKFSVTFFICKCFKFGPV